MKKITRQKMVDYNVYRAKDGKEFPSEQECLDYEKILDGKRIKGVVEFIARVGTITYVLAIVIGIAVL